MPSGPGDILDLIRRGRAHTRGDILDLTGLSRMTVAQRVDALLAAGIIVE
jgi:DNA-binding Lrp family transcriptional regulator